MTKHFEKWQKFEATNQKKKYTKNHCWANMFFFFCSYFVSKLVERSIDPKAPSGSSRGTEPLQRALSFSRLNK